MAELTATWSPEDDYLGTLDIRVQSAGFTGHSYAWFDKGQLKETFIAALRAYPIDADSAPFLEGDDSAGAEATKSLRIAVTPHDRRGTLLVRVDLVFRGRPHNPMVDKEHTVKVQFLTEYGMLERFAADLDALLEGKMDAATLRSKDP